MKEKARATIISGLHAIRMAKVEKSCHEPLKTALRCPTNSMCMSMLHIHVHVHAARPCPSCMSMSPLMLHVMSILHVRVHAACPCPYACPCPFCRSRYMLYFHFHASCSCPGSCCMPMLMLMLHAHAAWCMLMPILHVHAACLPTVALWTSAAFVRGMLTKIPTTPPPR